ncbi:hypothetical protein J1614_012257 [Plenodomus biglobosus]|nr:hypothetical protein J1614_012257 [Plenodomus biglobosus]
MQRIFRGDPGGYGTTIAPSGDTEQGSGANEHNVVQHDLDVTIVPRHLTRPKRKLESLLAQAVCADRKGMGHHLATPREMLAPGAKWPRTHIAECAQHAIHDLVLHNLGLYLSRAL